MHSIGSIAELKEMSDNCPDDIELHRPYIDDVTITCPECGKQMHRVPEVIDCWFDSGSMPFAQHHYPFENEICSNSSSRQTYFRGGRPDKRMVLLSACDFYIAV